MKKLSLLLFLALQAQAAEHVVLVVWDGLRPDSINTRDTPTLAQLAHKGVFFANHHSVYITSTEVNGVALATGCAPACSGILANREYRPKIKPLMPVNTEDPKVFTKGDSLTDGHYLTAPTLPETLRGHGLTTAIAGTKAVAKLFDRNWPGLFVNPGRFSAPNSDLDSQTTRHLLENLWGNRVPSFSLLWLSEPDISQHRDGPGSPRARFALRRSDQNLARILETLRAQGVDAQTDILVVSDHGFSTVSRTVDVAMSLRSAGFSAQREFRKAPTPGEMMVVGLGGSVLIYVTGHEPVTVSRAVEFLQQQDFTGVIFTREPLPGTFPLSMANLDTPDAPDIIVALRWSEAISRQKTPGMLVSDRGRRPGQGTHASLSRYDLRNTLVATGLDFPAGTTNRMPSSNADLAPTILALLGVQSDSKPRQLLTRPESPFRTTRLVAENGHWRQYLQLTECDGITYIDEGNCVSH